jgi:hypothetical protein
MAQSEKHFDADALLIGPTRLVAPDGSSASLKEYTEDDVLALLRVLQDIQKLPQAQMPLHLADALLLFFEDEEAGRRVVDALPLPRIMDVVTWLQEAISPTLTLPDAPDGEVKLGGQVRAVRIPTIGTYRDLAPAAAEGDVYSIISQNAAVMASMVEGMTPEAWRALPRRQSAAVERYISDLMAETGAKAKKAAPARRGA